MIAAAFDSASYFPSTSSASTSPASQRVGESGGVNAADLRVPVRRNMLDFYPIEISLQCQENKYNDTILVEIHNEDKVLLLGDLITWCHMNGVNLRTLAYSSFGMTMVVDSANITRDDVVQACHSLIQTQSMQPGWRVT